MSIKKKLGVSAAFLGASLALANPAYTQNPSTRDSSYKVDSTPGSLYQEVRQPLSGLQTFPGNTYFLVTRKNANGDSSQNSYSNQTQTPAPRRGQRSPAWRIYSRGELTAAGDGILAKDYVNHVVYAPEETFSLKDYFSSRYRMHFNVTDREYGLERIARHMGPDSRLNGRDREFKHYLLNFARRLGHNNAESVREMREALADGIIQPGEWSSIREGAYMAVVSTRDRRGRTKQSVPVLLDFRRINYTEKTPTIQIPIVNTDSIAQARADSIMRESRRIAEEREASERRAFDSTANAERARANSLAQARADSILRESRRISESNIVRGKAGTPPEFVPPTGRRTLEAGLELETGTNNEVTTGAFVNAGLPFLRAEAFGNYSFVKEGLYSTGTVTDTTQRESQLIGIGLYENRTDETTTSGRERGIAELGGRIIVAPFNWLDLAFGAGERMTQGTENIYEKSTINFDANNQHVRDPQVIDNSATINTSGTNPFWSIEARAKMGRIGIQGSYEETRIKFGRQNKGQDRWKIGARLTF